MIRNVGYVVDHNDDIPDTNLATSLQKTSELWMKAYKVPYLSSRKLLFVLVAMFVRIVFACALLVLNH